jgi:hypothetical protein
MKTKLGNTVYFTTLTRWLLQFVIPRVVRTEQRVSSYVCAGLRERSGCVRWLSGAASAVQHHQRTLSRRWPENWRLRKSVDSARMMLACNDLYHGARGRLVALRRLSLESGVWLFAVLRRVKERKDLRTPCNNCPGTREPPNIQKTLAYCQLFQTFVDRNPDNIRFQLLRYINSQNTRMRTLSWGVPLHP